MPKTKPINQPISIKEIVKKYLEENGYDGLCSEDCGCGLSDFVPCGELYQECIPAYKNECNLCLEQDKCEFKSKYNNITSCYSSIKKKQK